MRGMTDHEKADRVLSAAYFLEAGVQADDPERKVWMEYLDDENFVVNVDVISGRGCCPEDDAWLSEQIASELADAMVQALNAFDPVDGMEWYRDLEPNYLDEDGNECSPEDRDCQTVKYRIYTTEK